MNILLIDTVGRPNLVGIGNTEKGMTEDRSWTADGDEAERILPAVREIMGQDRKADAIVCVNGPGRFTSTRIGVAVANALSMAWEIPVIGMDRLSFVRSLMPEYDPKALAVPSEREGGYYFTPSRHDHAIRFADGLEALPKGCEVIDEERFAKVWPQRRDGFFISMAEQAISPSMDTPIAPLYVRPPNITTMKRL